MPPMTAAEAMLYCTVKLHTSKGGVSTGSGTGFFYKIDLGSNRHATLIITNKHVIEGSSQVNAICHLQESSSSGPSGKLIEC